MDYTTALLWYASWPVLIWIAYRFVLINIRHHANIERLESYDRNCPQPPQPQSQESPTDKDSL